MQLTEDVAVDPAHEVGIEVVLALADDAASEYEEDETPAEWRVQSLDDQRTLTVGAFRRALAKWVTESPL